MLEARIRRLKQATRTVEEQEYHKLVLLVGDFSSGKTRLMRQVRNEIGGVYLNVNLELPRRLLTVDARTYATRASRILQELGDDLEPGRPLFLDNVELLFSPEVGCLNPVDLFKKVAREWLIVLSLPCRMKGQAQAETPKSYSDIYTAFVKALQVPEDQIPEIKTLLEENFVQVNSHYKRPEMLEKRELEARRQQRLLASSTTSATKPAAASALRTCARKPSSPASPSAAAKSASATSCASAASSTSASLRAARRSTISSTSRRRRWDDTDQSGRIPCQVRSDLPRRRRLLPAVWTTGCDRLMPTGSPGPRPCPCVATWSPSSPTCATMGHWHAKHQQPASQGRARGERPLRPSVGDGDHYRRPYLSGAKRIRGLASLLSAYSGRSWRAAGWGPGPAVAAHARRRPFSGCQPSAPGVGIGYILVGTGQLAHRHPFEGMGESLPPRFEEITLAHLLSLPVDARIPFEPFADRLIQETRPKWTAPNMTYARMFLQGAVRRIAIEIPADFGAVEPEYQDTLLGRGTIQELAAFQITAFGKGLLASLVA